MTISDYKVTDNATLALIKKQNEYDGSQVCSLKIYVWSTNDYLTDSFFKNA